MVPHSLDRLLAPRSIALIGASDQHDSLGTAFTRQALDAGFSGEIHLVNRHRTDVFGRACLHDARELPEGVDLALVLTPWDSVAGIIDTLAKRACGGAVVVGIASSTAWQWTSNASQLKRLRQQVARSGLRIVGPASQGLTLSRLGLNLSLCPALPPPGGIGFVSTSGAVAGVIADWAATRGVGMSALVSLGDEIDVDVADCLDWFARDAGTRAVLVHVDALNHARHFLSAARALSFRKPLVILKPHETGRTPDDPAAVLSDAVHRAAFTRAGMLQAHDLEEFCAAANVDLPAWPHAGQRFAIAGNGSALGALAADAVFSSGGALAQPRDETALRLRALLPRRAAIGNPLDLLRDAGPERYAGAVAALAADSNIDVVLLLHHPTSFGSGRDIAQALNPVPQGEALVLAAFAAALVSTFVATAGDTLRSLVVATVLGFNAGLLALLGASASQAFMGIGLGAASGVAALWLMVRGPSAPATRFLLLPLLAFAALAPMVASLTGGLSFYALLPLLAVAPATTLLKAPGRALWQQALLAGGPAVLPMLLSLALAWFRVGAASA